MRISDWSSDVCSSDLLVNLVSKTPEFKTGGELSLVYGSYNRKEVLGDVNVALTNNLAIRAVARVRDADTYVDHVPDDSVMCAPSIRWQPTPDPDVVLNEIGRATCRARGWQYV